MNSTVSVIIPVYNVEQYIEKCINSIVEQSYRNLEILIIDDGTTDNSINKIKKLLDSRCKVISKTNGGLSSARNCGLVNSTGNYIFFVDADDWLENSAIETLVNCFKTNDIDIAQGSARYCYEKFDIIDNVDEGILKNDMVLEYFKQKNLKTYVWNKLYSRSIIGDYKFKIGYNHEDVIFTYQIAKLQPKIYNTSSVIYNYIQRNNSIMNQVELQKKISSLDACDVIIEDCLNNNLYVQSAYFNKYITCIYLISDALNGDLSYTREEMNKLKNEINGLKKVINIGYLRKKITKKNYYIYISSLLSYKLTAIFFKRLRKSKRYE